MNKNLTDIVTKSIVAINVGVQDFGEALEEQEVKVFYVDWSPPAGGDQELMDLLDRLL